MMLLTSMHLPLLGHRPVVSRSFTISGSLLVLLIIFIILGFTHFLVVLIHALFRHYSTRYLLDWAQGGALAGDSNSRDSTSLRGEAEPEWGRDQSGTEYSRIIWANN